MASVVPPNINDAISFFENHLLPWVTNQPNIGVTIQQVTDISTATTGARNAFNAAQTIRDDSKNSTIAMKNAVDAMRLNGAAFMKTVRAFAEAQGNPAVLQLASIPPVPEAAPLPPPGQPLGVTGTINVSGQVELTWKAIFGDGSFFQVERKLVDAAGIPEANWDIIGSVQGLLIIDTTVPKGNSAAQYQVTAQRGGLASQPSDTSIIRFGSIAAAA